MLATHDPEMQSVGMTQDSVFWHGGQAPPPQSTSVSVPFLKRSLQFGTLQVVSQKPLAQSLDWVHVTPVHRVQSPCVEQQVSPAGYAGAHVGSGLLGLTIVQPAHAPPTHTPPFWVPSTQAVPFTQVVPHPTHSRFTPEPPQHPRAGP